MKTANDYSGATDSDCIEAAFAGREGGVVCIPRRQSRIEPERDWWQIDRAILVPGDTTVILRNCTIKLSDKCRDNFFRSANCGLGINEIEPLSDIHIIGQGHCELVGADHPRATGDSEKTLERPCPKKKEDKFRLKPAYITREDFELCEKTGGFSFGVDHMFTYGTDAGKEGESQLGDWRNIGILLARVQRFSIENVRIAEPHAWAISLEDCAHGRIEKIDFQARMARVIDGMEHNIENQDGIDLRNGCHDIIISDITGTTGDDVIALTAINNFPVGHFHNSGALKSTHVMHSDYSRRDPNIHDVIIRNVAAYSAGGVCGMIRLLPIRSKIWNVVIDGVIDTKPHAGQGFFLIGVRDCYGGSSEKGDIHHVAISNIVSNCDTLFAMSGYMEDSSVSKVIMKNPDASYASYWPENLPDREHAFTNVLTNNIVKAQARR